jgi:transposase
MAAIPTLEEEDARRPGREREHLVGERVRITNRLKAAFTRLGIRNFKPALRGAANHLEPLRTPEGVPLPPNTLAELRRDMARLKLVTGQIKQIEALRLERLEESGGQSSQAIGCWRASPESVLRPPICRCMRFCREACGIAELSRAMPA